MLVGVGRVGGVGRSGGKIGPSAKTYADFVAHITGRAVSGSVAWTAALGGEAGTKRIKTTVGFAFSGDMFGSPWTSRVAMEETAVFSNISRVVQHSLPTADTSAAIPGREMFLEYYREGASNPALIGVVRNNFASQGAGENLVGSGYVTELLAWVGPDVGGYAIKMQPNFGLGPTPYDW